MGSCLPAVRKLVTETGLIVVCQYVYRTLTAVRSAITAATAELLKSWKRPSGYRVVFAMNMSRFDFPQWRCLICQ